MRHIDKRYPMLFLFVCLFVCLFCCCCCCCCCCVCVCVFFFVYCVHLKSDTGTGFAQTRMLHGSNCWQSSYENLHSVPNRSNGYYRGMSGEWERPKNNPVRRMGVLKAKIDSTGLVEQCIHELGNGAWYAIIVDIASKYNAYINICCL